MLFKGITFWNLSVWVRLERTYFNWFSALTSGRSARTGQPILQKIWSWCFSWTLQLRVYVAHSSHCDSCGSNPSSTLLYLNLGGCLMSGGVQTILCPPGSGIFSAREEAISRTSPSLELACIICDKLSTLVLLKKHNFYEDWLCQTFNFYLASNTAV